MVKPETLVTNYDEPADVSIFDGLNDMPEDELVLAANKWEIAHGGLSGRTASQFIDYLRGGMQINLHVAIDFTGSNGASNLPNSLYGT